MKKIALIEDRYKRQTHFLEQNSINIDDYEINLDNFIEEKATNILENIFNNHIDLIEFDIIICHKSVENNTLILGNIKDYCKKYQKTLVLFSGGISVNYYDNSEFEFLELNSKTFYSQNLKLFLESIKTYNEDIMMLCYGEQWKQNIVANVLEKTNLFIFDIQNGFEDTTNFRIDPNLSKIDYKFYELKKKTLDEIIKFKESLEAYFSLQLLQKSKRQSVIIHHDNICDLQIFNHHIKFIQSSDDIDTYISKEIINELKNKEFDTIFIKDNLSSNYLELYGLRVAYHIRFSNELSDKKFTPIVIISDFDENTLNRFTQEANILFKDGMYLCKNTKEDIEKFKSLELKNVTDYDKFLAHTEILPPKDISGSHDIANKWSIYKWAKILKTNSETIEENKSQIEDILYFKYLKALYQNQNFSDELILKPTETGKVLLIDDEWNNGWNYIIKNILKDNEKIEYDCFEYDFKDKSNFNLYMQIQKKIKDFNPDVVVLDLRLSQSDHENNDINSYTGIKILEKIHKINAGIQVIMLTATSKSSILEKLYEKKILGYIKKEHPEDKNIDTIENINNFLRLVDKGLDKKYLKEVWNLQREILNLDILKSENKNYNRIYFELSNTFKILESNLDKKVTFYILAIYNIIELLVNEFGFTDGSAYKNITKNICHKYDLFQLDTELSKIICTRNYLIHIDGAIRPNCKKNTIKEPTENHLTTWLKVIHKILVTIDLNN